MEGTSRFVGGPHDGELRPAESAGYFVFESLNNGLTYTHVRTEEGADGPVYIYEWDGPVRESAGISPPLN